MHRANAIPATRQADIERAFAALDAEEIGAFNVDYLRKQTERYLRTGSAFCVACKSDGEFMAMFDLNLSDMRAASGRLRQLERVDG